MDKMFCFQCEQTARQQSGEDKLTGCTKVGVCGKNAEVAHAQDELTCALISLASAAEAKGYSCAAVVDLLVDGLFTTVTNVSFDEPSLAVLKGRILAKAEELSGVSQISADALFHGDENLVSLRSTLLLGLRGMAAYAHHARVLGYRDEVVDAWFVKGLAALVKEHSVEEWLGLLMEFGKMNLNCMAKLDEANTATYGNPVPIQVTQTIEPGPFIIISGHDLHDLKMLLDQVAGKGVNVYTHGEMLPAHGYPELKKYPELKGNFGTAWQNQRVEFDGVPAPMLFTTNCIMPQKDSYQDRVYTTACVQFPGLVHIEEDADGNKDFSAVINQAIELGGYAESTLIPGINGGAFVTTGFGRQTVLDNAPTIIDAVKQGAIKHFFLVGGCDGARPGRNYYTEFVKQAPSDTVILTLACGKFRFNDLDIGSIGPFPRILDMGQCNDSYGAVQVALALAGAFDCGVNDLPLTLVLSWYEQKAVCVLLTLLSLGIKNIYIGPSLPAFFSDVVLTTLVEMFDLHPISTAEEDLKAILG